MSSQQGDTNTVYEQDEVLWAKIRGYPWWPAFVDQMHIHPKRPETEYTVCFFGDNTHAKLGASKLRKFIEFYTEFYPKAKTNRRLMISIQKAEEKLQQNDQNVSIFQEMRNSLKKKAKGQDLVKKESYRSDPLPDYQQQGQPLPELIKSKTNAGRMMKKRQIQEEDEDQNEQLERIASSANNNQYQSSNVKHQQVASIKKGRLQLKRDKKQDSKDKNVSKKSRVILSQQKRQDIFQQQSEQEIVVQKQQDQHPDNKLNQNQQIQIDQQYIRQLLSEEKDNINQDIQSQKEIKSQIKNPRNLKSATFSRRRGRPKKEPSQIQSQKSQQKFNTRGRRQVKRKFIKKYTSSPKKHIEQADLQNLSKQDKAIIENTHNLLENRQSLIDYLETANISHLNAKEILDLDVSNILQNGYIDSQVQDILQLLKTALLFKYFPDDIRNKRKYERLVKKKNQTVNDRLQREKESIQHSQERQIRKKTIIKLQKFLKMHPDVESKAKEVAVKIQSYFKEADSQIGDRYKIIAYKVLSNLKDKKETFTQVMSKLDKHAYDE